MNKTEQKRNKKALTEDLEAALLKEHATDDKPTKADVKKRRKLPKSAKRFIVGCLAFNVLFAATVVVVACIRLSNKKAEEAPAKPAESSVADEHEGEFFIEDDALGGMWLPISENLQKSQLDEKKFHKNGDILTYDGAKLGIDLSEFQTVTDWEAVKAAGVEFVMVRVGRRGYETGLVVEDNSYRQHIEEAQKAGLDVGVYFYSQAVTTNEAREEARFVLDCIKDYKITYPVVFDWELVMEETARTYEMKNDQLNAVAHAFLDTIEEGGYRPMLYFYKYLGYQQYVLDEFADCDFWLSEPGDRPTFYYETAMWQYNVEGELPGVEGTVDLNLCFKPYT